MKKLFVKTYGCQMNAYDSARMADLLAPLGYAAADAPEDADMVILNTCHIREKAAEKVYSELGACAGRRSRRRKAGARMLIAVAGCVAQAEGEEIVRARSRAVDHGGGAAILSSPAGDDRPRRARARAMRWKPIFRALEKFDSLPRSRHATPASAPFSPCRKAATSSAPSAWCPTRAARNIRGPWRRSRPKRGAGGKGAREIVLLGQNVNAYRGAGTGRRSWSLARLLAALAEIEGLARLRYTTSHPRDMGDDLIAAHGDIEKLMPYLHLPVQSGSDTRAGGDEPPAHRAMIICRLVERIRAARPDIALSSDFIVGFPGESDADFEATWRWCATSATRTAFSFKYSPRPGTPAAAARKQIPEDVKSDAAGALQTLLLAQQDAVQQIAAIGKTLPVLFEKPGREPGQVVGRTPYLQPVHVEGAGAPDRHDRATCASSARYRQQPEGVLQRRKRAGALSPPRQTKPRARTGHAGIRRQRACWRRWAARIRSISCAWSRSWTSASPRAAIWWRSTARRRRANAPPPSCARCMRGWKRAKASPWPKWMRKSASPIHEQPQADGDPATARSRPPPRAPCGRARRRKAPIST